MISVNFCYYAFYAFVRSVGRWDAGKTLQGLYIQYTVSIALLSKNWPSITCIFNGSWDYSAGVSTVYLMICQHATRMAGNLPSEWIAISTSLFIQHIIEFPFRFPRHLLLASLWGYVVKSLNDNVTYRKVGIVCYHGAAKWIGTFHYPVEWVIKDITQCISNYKNSMVK